MQSKNLKIDILAGVSTFLTMSYIIVVNPSILSTPGTGMSFSGVLTGTVLISFFATLLMGLYAKLPFALAPGMGLNAFFTFSLVLGQKIPWQTALGMVFWSGILFIILSLTPLREMLIKAIPKHLRIAMAVGIGVFLSFIGLKGGGIVISDSVTFVKGAHLSHQLVMTLLGLFVIAFFYRMKNPFSFLFSIIGVTLISVITGDVKIPGNIFSRPDFHSVFMQVDFIGSLSWAFIPSMLTLMITDLFDTMSTLIGVSHSTGLVDEKGEPKNMKKALVVDAVATTFSSLFGTSPTTTYIESSTGIELGGKSGRSSIVTALCFLPFLFIAPLAGIVPSYATAPVLIFVGILMFKSVSEIDFSTVENALPAFLIILLIPFSFSITHGIVFGLLSHTIMYLICGRIKEVHPLLILISILCSFILI